MSFKIIKPGNPDKEMSFSYVICSWCKCEFEATQDKVKTKRYPREVTECTVKCPWCGTKAKCGEPMTRRLRKELDELHARQREANNHG